MKLLSHDQYTTVFITFERNKMRRCVNGKIIYIIDRFKMYNLGRVRTRIDQRKRSV